MKNGSYFSNHQNVRIWAPSNPNISVASKRLHGEKIMFWAGFVGGKMLKIHWFIDSKGKTVSVNRESCLKMLKEVLWPQIRYSVTRKEFWFQQDGARPHTCRTVLDFLREKFHGRILSNLTDRIWPPYSPDLNPLDQRCPTGGPRAACGLALCGPRCLLQSPPFYPLLDNFFSISCISFSRW